MSKRTTGTARSTSRHATPRTRSAKGCNPSRSVWRRWRRKIKRCAKSLQSFTPAESYAEDNGTELKGSCRHDLAPTTTPVHSGDGGAKGPPRRRRLELAQPGEGFSCLHGRFPLAKP